MDRIQYNEFSLFTENISEYSLTVSPMPPVTRVNTTLNDGRVLSALKWGTEEPRLVLVHGSGQNAHTWDTVALALNIPLIAVDLPGHGHSSWREDATYSPQGMAQDIAQVMRAHAKHAVAVVGMSLGGLTCLALAHAHQELVPHLVLVGPSRANRNCRLCARSRGAAITNVGHDLVLEQAIAHGSWRSVSCG